MKWIFVGLHVFFFYFSKSLLHPDLVIDLEYLVKWKKVNCIDVFQDNSIIPYLPAKFFLYSQLLFSAVQIFVAVYYSFEIFATDKIERAPKISESLFQLKFTKASSSLCQWEAESYNVSFLLPFLFFHFSI